MIDYDKYKFSTGTHWIANSGKDENSGTQGGRAGDQTGHEAEVRKYYVRPWTVVLRYPDQAVADKIADLSIAMCLNPKVGYDQDQRGTYWQELQKVGYDPSKIVTACEEDCTAGVSANVKAAGYLCGEKALQILPLCNSRNMREKFAAAGFIVLTATKYLSSPDYLLPGDVLLCEGHHAAMNITLGSAVRADWHPEDAIEPPVPEVPPFDIGDDLPEPPYVRTTGNVHIRKGPGTSYDSMGTVKPGHILHYFGFSAPNGWYLVEYNRATGWVSPKYAELEDV